MTELTGELTAQGIALLKVWGPALLFASLASLGIFAAYEYLLGPIFRLLGARAYATFQAVRPLLALISSSFLFHRLHLSGVVDFGPGPAGWEKAGLMSILGATGSHVVHVIVKRYWPSLILEGRPPDQKQATNKGAP